MLEIDKLVEEQACEDGAEPIVVSACLLGEPCRYDGKSCPNDTALALLKDPAWRVVPICPEMMGGLPCPRTPVELVWGETGSHEGDSLEARKGEVAPGHPSEEPSKGPSAMAADGCDCTEEFRAGAQAALGVARAQGCRVALLKAKSPSCGSGVVYDGSFQGRLAPGWGMAARLLADNGIRVLDENEWAASQRD